MLRLGALEATAMRLSARRGVAPVLLVVLAAVTSSWGGLGVDPAPGLGPSWAFALHAWASGSSGHVGVLDFTYGPLGFLTQPMLWGRRTYGLAALFAFLNQVALCYLVLLRLRRYLRPVVAVLGTLLLAALAPGGAEVTPLVVALACAELLGREQLPHRALWWAGGSVAAGALLLTKLSTGLVCLAVVLVTVFALSAARPVARLRATLGAAVVALATSWLLFGLITREPGSFPSWWRAASQLSSGYVAMALEDVPRRGPADYVAFLCVAVPVLALAASLVVRRRTATAAASGAIVALVTYLAFREGFTRHDNWHVAVALAMVTIIPLALPTTGAAGRWVVALCLLPVVLGTAVTHTSNLDRRLDLAGNAWATADHAAVMVTAHSRQDDARAAIKETYHLPNPVVVALRGHRVQVDPYDTAIVWAYRFRWAPAKVFQLYSAYTPALDDANARSILSPDGPDRILRRRLRGIDGRNGQFDSPAYQLAELCGWHEVVASRYWQVLAPNPYRCLRPRPLGQLHLESRQVAEIPQPSDPTSIVTVRITPDLPASYRLLAALFKPTRKYSVSVDGATWRLVVATAGQPLVLRAPAGLIGGATTFEPVSGEQLYLDVPATVTFEEVPRW